MLKIDEDLLKDLGLGGLADDDKNQMLAQIYETLEIRVGMTLAKQMNDIQLKEFEGFVDSNDEKGALTWLENNFPDYKNVVHQELDKLKGEIRANSAQIIAEMNAPKDQSASETPVA